MNAIVENFAAELRADPRYSIHADAFLRGYREGEAQAVLNRETRKYLSAVLWILAEPGRGLDEKIEALMKLNGLPRCHVLIPSMRKFVGWDGDPH